MWLLPSASSPELRTSLHQPKPFPYRVKEAVAHSPARTCYEAGPLGDAPKQHLKASGVPCEVIAPSLIARQPSPAVQSGQAGREETGGPQPGRRNYGRPHPTRRAVAPRWTRGA